MQTVIIIEDEAPAARRLTSMLKNQEQQYEVIACLDSIEDSVQWLQANTLPDLIFMDIMLADGQSFEIFDKIRIDVPVIFTTAYDEYALKAFQVNSVDYLLKPIDPLLLAKALKKHDQIYTENANLRKLIAVFLQTKSEQGISQEQYKERFLVKTGEKTFSVPIADVAYFYSENGIIFLITKLHMRYMLDFTLDELERLINPHEFYRLNRQVIASFSAIRHFNPYFNGKLKVQLIPDFAEGVIISKDKAPLFKQWLNK